MSESWKPNEDFLHQLVSMGIDHELANQALFCTGNSSVQQALDYIYNDEEALTTDHLTTDLQRLVDEDEDPEEHERFKMTFVVNMSLKMGVGKIAAQVGHACLGLYREMLKQDSKNGLETWEHLGEKKIVLKGVDEFHLMNLFEKAKAEHLPCYLVQDAGHTQIAAGSVTVLSLFGLEEAVNNITGSLTLL